MPGVAFGASHTTWSPQRVPLPPGSKSAVCGCLMHLKVACTAVGDWSPDRSEEAVYPLVERWGGRVWALQPTPRLRPAGTEGSLYVVSCATVQVCVAVGVLSSPDFSQFDLAMTWNGRRWRVERPGSDQDTLASVSCASPRTCLAVGGWECPQRRGGRAMGWVTMARSAAAGEHEPCDGR